MSDQSPFSIKERIIVSVWVHDRYLNGKLWTDIMNDFETRFHNKSPAIQTLLKWEKKHFKTLILK